MNALRSRPSGQALVEFALVLPILLLILMGIFDFGRAIFAYNEISNAAREGVRKAIVNQDASVITDEALLAATSLQNTAVVTITSCPVPVQIGCLISVKVDYPWVPITPIISAIVPPMTLTATTTKPVERVYSSSTP